MDQIWQSVILGILQGLTEFLPISSSAHLILLPWAADWSRMGLLFDLFLHAGTLFAVMLYFRREVKELFFEGIGYLKPGMHRDQGKTGLLPVLVVGTVPAGISAILFRSLIEDHARTPGVTAATLFLFAMLLWWADRAGRRCRVFSEIGWKEGLLVGAAQAIALVPGVSRSGVTMTMALLLGFSRKDAARFSFLLSLPILVLGTLKGALEILAAPGETAAGAIALLVGVGFSFLSGFLCIKYFLRYLESRSFTPFVVYRIILSAIIVFMIIS